MVHRSTDVLGTRSPWQRVATAEARRHGITQRPWRCAMGRWGPGCFRCSKDRGDFHPLSSVCPQGHQIGRNLSLFIQSDASTGLVKQAQLKEEWQACHIDEVIVQLLDLHSPTPALPRTGG